MSEEIPTAASSMGPSCVLELVLIELSEPGETAFETALGAAAPLLRATPGYCGHQAGRCIEEPGRALMVIWWERLEDHTLRFRGSPAYLEWRRLLDPHIRPGPLVRHFQPKLEHSALLRDGRPGHEMPG